MSLRLEAMPDDKNTLAILYGPIVLAGCLGDLSAKELQNHNTAPSDPPAAVPALLIDRDNLAASIKPSGKPLEFRVRAKDAELRSCRFIPLSGSVMPYTGKLYPRSN